MNKGETKKATSSGAGSEKLPELGGGDKDAHGVPSENATTYLESLIHFIKGNVGSGIFALSEGFKNAGIIVAPILTVVLGIACLYCEHLLLSCSKMLKERKKLSYYPCFADTIQQGFECGPPWIRIFSRYVKPMVNAFIIITHLGFCCVYIIFISSTSKHILHSYGIDFSIRLHMVVAVIPISLSTLVRSLKYLVPMSFMANLSIGFGICATVYLIGYDLPPISSRRYFGDWKSICMFFGTAMYSFEGIGLVLPLKTVMKNPDDFDSPAGVLNVGMVIVLTVFTMLGFLGYLRFGENVQSSVTLNLPPELILSQVVKVAIAFGILLTYGLMFYVAIIVIWPMVNKKFGPFKHPLVAEMLCRVVVVFITFFLSEVIPHLGLFISLIGAFSTSALALGVPPLCDIALRWPSDFGAYSWRLVLDILSLTLGAVGFLTGTYCSLEAIVKAFIAES